MSGGCFRFSELFRENADQHPQEDPYHDPGPTPPLLGCPVGLSGMVVAVIDEVVRDRVAMPGVELLEELLGDFLLLFLDLPDEAIGLFGSQRMNVITVEIDVLEVAQFIDLILADRGLIILPVGYVEGLIHHVGVNPIL